MTDTIPREIAKGKTKIITQALDRANEVDILETNRLTAGNGKRDEMCPRKGEYVTQVNHHAMSLFRRAGLPVAYIRRTGLNTRRDILCSMLLYEVTATREVTKPSSLRKREPYLEIGTRFDELRVNFFLKTKGRKFGHHELPDDDPLITGKGKGGVLVCRPDLPIGEGNPVTHIGAELLFGRGGMHPFEEMERLIRRGFSVLEYAWAQQGWRLCDWKGEFGFSSDGKLLFADTIDPDSWRLFNEKGEHCDKQPFRDDAPVEVMSEIYREIAERIKRFDEIDPASLPI